MKTRLQRWTALLVASAMTMAVGCATPSRRPTNPTRTGRGGVTTPAPGVGTRGGTTGGGAAGGGMTGRGTTGMPGGTTGARLGATPMATHDQRDLGAQISASVAGMDGWATGMAGTMAGGARAPMAGRPGGVGTTTPMGVSTLVIGNMAFVGIHMPAGATGTTGAAGMPGTTVTDGAAPGAVGPATRGMVPPTVTDGRVRAPGTHTAPGQGTTHTTPGVGAPGAGTTHTTPGITGANLHDQVRNHVRSTHPQITDVFVTTDPTMVSRLAQIGAEIEGHQSTVSRMPEIFAIAQEMSGHAHKR